MEEDPAGFSRVPKGIYWLTYDPTGGRLATAPGDASISVWDTSSGAKVVKVKEQPNTYYYACFRFSPDGHLLASAISNGLSMKEYDIIVWETKTWVEVARFGHHTGYVPCIAFSPDGSRPASANRDRTVRVWDVTTGHELLNFAGHADDIDAVAFTPDGHRLMSVSSDRTVRTWDATPLPAP
jgi:WD40 repeat protein